MLLPASLKGTEPLCCPLTAQIIFPHSYFVTHTAYSLLPPKGWKRMHTPAKMIYTHWLIHNIPYVHFPRYHTSPCCVSYSTSIITCSLLCPPHHPTSWIYSNFKVTALLRRRKSLCFILESHDACLSQCKCPFAAPSSTELQVSISSNSCSLHAGSNYSREKTQPGSTHKISFNTRVQTCLRVTEAGFKKLGLIVFVWGFGLLFCGALFVCFSKISSWVVTNP